MPAKPRRAGRRVLTALLLLALCAGSATVTTMLTRPQISVPATQVAVVDSAPVLQLIPLVPHAVPAAAASTSAGPVVASGGCITVPILLYHYIRVNPVARDRNGFQLSVTPANFQAQMDWLRQAGSNPVTLEQMMGALHGGPGLPAHPVVLTFDDGYVDFATVAAPILHRNGFVGIDYVVSGFMGRSSYMTDTQVKQVDAMGMVVGAHTVHHVNLNVVSAQIANTEITASKATLEQLLGHPVLDFAYPYGGVNRTVADLVGKAGFREAVTTSYGVSQCDAQKNWLHRIRVGGFDTVGSVAADAGVAQPPPGWKDPGLPPPPPSPSPSPSPPPSPPGSPGTSGSLLPHSR
jgi:peptidoglycan/xylan/chitin deacetylase (PgdA/CDA1 family)